MSEPLGHREPAWKRLPLLSDARLIGDCLAIERWAREGRYEKVREFLYNHNPDDYPQKGLPPERDYNR